MKEYLFSHKPLDFNHQRVFDPRHYFTGLEINMPHAWKNGLDSDGVECFSLFLVLVSYGLDGCR